MAQGAPLDDATLGFRIAAIGRLPLDCEAGDVIHFVGLGDGAITEDVDVTVSPIAGMKSEAVNEIIANGEKGVGMIGVQIVQQFQNARRAIGLTSLLNDKQTVGPRFGSDEDGLVPFYLGEYFFDGVRQGWIGRTDET